MADDSKLLRTIEGEELEAVTFVCDYMQLTFPSARINMDAWPHLQIGDRRLTIEDQTHERELHNLVSKPVVKVDAHYETRDGISINFEGVTIFFNPTWDEVLGPELMMFKSLTTTDWEVWRGGGEEPFREM